LNKFLYLIETKHYIKREDGTFTRLVGYGITSNHDKRLNSYIGHSGSIDQDFSQLYWGPADAIKELEKFQKQAWRHMSLTLDAWALEWINPDQNKTISDLEKFFDDKIKRDGLPIFKVKQEFMPYTRGFPEPAFTSEDLESEPDKFLDKIA
jgi:hypothetical protein